MLKPFFYFSLVLLISACGLNYQTIPTPINKTNERRASIQKHLTEVFAKDSAEYSHMAWGQSKTVKPLSYKQLDSLYAIKYNLERQGKRNSELENNIKIQRQIALSDTAPVLFIEDHLFSVKKNGVATVYSAVLEVDRDHVIRNSTINASNNLNPGMIEEFKVYTFEESFINKGYAPSLEERAFYARYKGRADELSGDVKDAFINHTLYIMQRARKARTLSSKDLLMEIVREEAHGKNRTGIQNETFESMQELVEKVNGADQIVGYQIVYSYQKVDNGLTTSYRYFIELSDYLEVRKKALM
jgi:hypothetical protein